MIFCCSRFSGTKTTRLDAGPGGRGGDGVGQVAGGRAGQHLQTELAGGGQRDGDDPVLERVGGVAGVVLHPQLLQAEVVGQVAGVDQPGVAGIGGTEGGDVGRHRQQRRVPPDRLRTGFDLGAGDRRDTRSRPRAGRSTPGTRRTGRAGCARRRPGRRGGWRCRTHRATAGGGIGGEDRSHRSVLHHLYPVDSRPSRSWHHGRSVGRLPGSHRAGPSSPLDEW